MLLFSIYSWFVSGHVAVRFLLLASGFSPLDWGALQHRWSARRGWGRHPGPGGRYGGRTAWKGGTEPGPGLRGPGRRGLQTEGTACHELPPGRAETTSWRGPWLEPGKLHPRGAIGENELGGAGGPFGGGFELCCCCLVRSRTVPNYPRAWALNSTALCYFASEPNLQPGKIKVALLGVAGLANKVGFIIPERATALSTSAPGFMERCLTWC